MSHTTQWAVQNFLQTHEDCQLYLQAAFDEAGDDAAFIAKALGDVARACNMSQLARSTGVSREGLYKSLCAEGNPSFSTILKVLHAMNLKLSVTAAH